MKNMKSNLLLILAAFIWGAAFCAQSVGMNYIGPFTFNGIRFIIGGLVLLPVIIIRRKTSPKKKVTAADKRTLHIAGITCGLILSAASALQQIGIVYTSPGKAGFITALYVILVPIAGIFFGKKSGFLLWISAILAIVGMYFLCLSETLSLSTADLLIFISAILFTAHIIVIDHYAPHVDGVALSSIQFFIAGVVNSVIMLFTETVNIEMIFEAKWAILYTGVLSCGVAYTLQIVGQRNNSPVVAAILLSLESVFSVLTAWVLLGDVLSTRELIGCITMFVAIILAQLPTPKLLRKVSNGKAD